MKLSAAVPRARHARTIAPLTASACERGVTATTVGPDPDNVAP
jgi:hypothetical protein